MDRRNLKQESLKEIIRQLHAKKPAAKLHKEFAKLIRETSAEEIAVMENALIEGGFPPEEIRRLCDVHARVLDASLKKAGKSSKMPGHPMPAAAINLARQAEIAALKSR